MSKAAIKLRAGDEFHIEAGDIVRVPGLGRRRVRIANGPIRCSGWGTWDEDENSTTPPPPHDIESGGLYVQHGDPDEGLICLRCTRAKASGKTALAARHATLVAAARKAIDALYEHRGVLCHGKRDICDVEDALREALGEAAQGGA